ncbi:ABC transporter substrate-binding protein [Maridesulfovibrio hydrothermalis]|uniref:Uncharacterized protein n=1 Tax=Maridesulfovibrio hydrothermalis AM13 = DSM 14728 TaxID=1121451 RepID=L0RIV9_9BACT|nr:hypothetical protein [Maridesulfovibrio hydrothermalis]CCO25516.1 protein of unknown function [Maridesulfovibrio hydrothermalis AM13 = DSM 14728]
MLEAHGASRILASFHDIVPNWIFTGLYFNDDYLAKHPDIVRKFLVGLTKSFDFVTNHEMEARKHLPKYTKVPEDICMICALRELQPAEPIARLNEQQELMVGYGFVKELHDLSPMIDYSYLPEGYRK